MSIKLDITLPSENIGFVENKRSFCVEGTITSNEVIPDDSLLEIYLYNSNNNLVRYVYCDKKNKDIFYNHPDLVTYKEELDPSRVKMQEFGFPILVVDDINNPYDSLNKGYIKAWYNDKSFKAIIINGSDSRKETIFKSGIEFVDENNKPYEFLEFGRYRIEVYLKHKDKVIASTSKQVDIGNRDKQLICRFNPYNHRQAMILWCKENDISIINDLMPGYLESYLGKWFYHMGLLQMYRANDIYLFEDVNVFMFDYLIDSTSTSYETELAYLQSRNLINKRLNVYYYDIGEANILDRKANIVKFEDNQYGMFSRVDEVEDINNENIYYLNRKDVLQSHFDLDNVEINSDCIAIMGIIKPIQLNPNDFILKNDNTYEILDYPKTIRYCFNIDGDITYIDRQLNMERIDLESIGNSVYEFYNKFNINNYRHIIIKAKCIYAKGLEVDIFNSIEIINGRITD